jgi:glyoxylase-like metal-dependent hydrolase (beta-lactamase superfamily II)
MVEPVRVAENVFLVQGDEVNWVLLRDGTDLTLVDGGYPGDVAAVEASIGAIGGRPEDVRAILVTHAHVDHLGAVNPFREKYGTPLYLDPAEVAHARREYLEQLSPARLLANLWRPGVLAWTRRTMRAGVTQDVTAAHAEPFPAEGPLDLPGAPLPVPTYGHTSGHTAYYLPGAGAVITGDALITGHSLARAGGPQLVPAFFTHDHKRAVAALDALADLDADTILPGHGPVYRGPARDAVAIARSRAGA